MATINIANLTFTHKGNYDGSTAYVKNDVVYYATNGNAYIAKQNTTGNAPTNGTYWSQWNAGLSLGSANQVVRVNSGASALEFGDLSSDFVKITSGTHSGTELNIDNVFTATYDLYKVYITITKFTIITIRVRYNKIIFIKFFCCSCSPTYSKFTIIPCVFSSISSCTTIYPKHF